MEYLIKSIQKQLPSFSNPSGEKFIIPQESKILKKKIKKKNGRSSLCSKGILSFPFREI